MIKKIFMESKTSMSHLLVCSCVFTMYHYFCRDVGELQIERIKSVKSRD